MTRCRALTARIKGAAVALLTATYFLSSVSLAAELVKGKADYRDYLTPYSHVEPYHERDLDSVRKEFAPYNQRDLPARSPAAGAWEVPKQGNHSMDIWDNHSRDHWDNHSIDHWAGSCLLCLSEPTR